MIYLDNAATTGKKPPQVIRAVERALQLYSANPGRGGHAASVRAGEMVYETRKKVAEFFAAPGEDRVVFTSGCTAALNMALKGNLKKGDHCILSSLEHNAVTRPAYALQIMGVEVEVAEVIFGDSEATLRAFEHLLRPNTRLIACTHSSNVTGEVLPVAKLGALCHKNNIIFVVDAAQTAGILPINMQQMQIDYLCIAPHKGLYAPMGVGVLIARQPPPFTILEGGTGVASAMPTQPLELPERLEPGTVNLPGIAGVGAGLGYVQQVGPERLYSHELKLLQQLYAGLSQMGGVQLYTPPPTAGFYTPVLSFNLRGKNSNDVAAALNNAGICVRGGLHCAPSAHKRLGTLEVGTVRVSPAGFNTAREVEQLLFTVKRLAAGGRRV